MHRLTHRDWGSRVCKQGNAYSFGCIAACPTRVERASRTFRKNCRQDRQKASNQIVANRPISVERAFLMFVCIEAITLKSGGFHGSRLPALPWANTLTFEFG